MPETNEVATNMAGSSPTPILDSGILPTPVGRKKSGGLVGFLTGIASVFVLVVVGKQATGLSPGMGLLSLFSAVALAVTVHEVGHLLAGRAVGFRFNSAQIGLVSLGVEHGRLRVRFHREITALGYAGMHVNGPVRLRRRLLIYSVAGPTANLLSIPGTVLLVNYVFPRMGNSWAAAPAAQFAFISLIIGIVSLLPIHSATFSDGARVGMLLRSPERTKRLLSIVAIGNLHDSGLRAKHWKRTWLRSAASVRDASSDEFIGNWLAYSSANDLKDAPVAAAHLERCLELSRILPPSRRDLIAQEAALFAAWFRKDGPLANKWIAQIKKAEQLPQLVRILLDLAVSCARRDFEAADAIWAKGFGFIENSTAGTAREQLRRSWLEWKEEIGER
jgi:hypothetical protein